ncbi:MAG: MFS transporter, partial [Boseongicola sp.]|nr:MFS transporter [Boseongicola sp.]
MRQFLPISSLLLGSFFLLFAGGVNSLILPVRGSAEGFSALSLGLLGTGWAIGYVSGCLFTARLVQRVGHIRAFSTLCSLAGIVILLQLVLLSAHTWILLRALQGFCFAGAAMIVESWLSERADPASRGRIFGIYTMVNLVASTAGQLTLTLGDTNGYFFFVLGAIFYMLALIPTAASSTQSPKPLVSVRLDLKALWKNSPVAVFAVFMVGVSNASFGTLAAVYADRIGLAVSSVAIFASVPILIGAVSQIPVGFLSDRMDRRKVLVGVASVALLADALFVFLAPESRWANLALAGLFGGAIFALYPIIIAHANDHAEGNFIRISGGLLLVFGLGSIAGPLIAGWAMSTVGERGLFMTTAVAHALMIAQALWRIHRRAPVSTGDKTDFQPGPAGRATTPQTIAMSATDEDL